MKYKIFIMLFLSYGIMSSQTTQTEVYSAGGGIGSNSGYTNFGTFGQPFASVVQSTSNIIREGFIFAQDRPADIVYVSADYSPSNQIWGYNYFDDLNNALMYAAHNATVNITNYTHTGDVDMTGYTFIIGSQDFVLDGELTGGVIRAINTGFLSLIPTQNNMITFPVTDGSNNETIKVICLNNPSQNIKVRIKNDQTITGGLTNPMDLWDIRGQNNLNATIKFRVDKAAIAPQRIHNWSSIRWFNGTRYELLPPDNVIVTEYETYFEITVTGINQFSNE